MRDENAEQLHPLFRGLLCSLLHVDRISVHGYPDDSPAKMAEEVQRRGYMFSCLNDQTREVAEEQRASIGCNIKWKADNEPDYLA